MVMTAPFLSTLVSLFLSVASIAGLVFLTEFAFKSKTVADKQCVQLSTKSSFGMIATKVAVVLLWIQIIVSASSAVLSWKMPDMPRRGSLLSGY
jgi:uncharacterized membrane-anchored protein